VCIATAAVLPAVGPAADQLAKTMSADVNLKVNWGALSNFDAVPIYQLAAAGNPTAIFVLQSLNAIPAYLTFGLMGNVSAFTQNDTQAGLAALSGLETYQTALAAGTGDPALLAGIDNFSGVPGLQKIAAGDRTGYYDLASTNATQAFDKWAASGFTDLNSFVPNTEPADPADFNSGYAALSGLQSYKNVNTTGNWAALSGIDAFSAIPSLQTLGNPASTQAQIWAAQRSLDSVSAIPEYQDAPPDAPADPPPPPPSGDSVAFAKTTSVEIPAAAAEETTKKSSNGSYSAKFTPAGAPVLFGSGGGKNAADNGIRGWGDAVNGLRAAVGLGPDPSTPSADAGGATS
jgi:hypothetical protein